MSASDSELIALWWYRFALEARTSPRPSAPNPDVLAQRSTRRHATLLWCVDGRPVAVAGAGSVVDGAVRIGPVYTPPADRGHHYGSAVTAAAVESALRRGASVVELFTDADYPTSNNIYRRLGFEQVDVFEEVDVTPIRTTPIRCRCLRIRFHTNKVISPTVIPTSSPRIIAIRTICSTDSRVRGTRTAAVC